MIKSRLIIFFLYSRRMCFSTHKEMLRLLTSALVLYLNSLGYVLTTLNIGQSIKLLSDIVQYLILVFLFIVVLISMMAYCTLLVEVQTTSPLR